MNLEKILILRFSSLGDIVMTTAMLRSLKNRFPGAHIDMVVGKEYLDLIQNNPNLRRKIGFNRQEGVSALWKLVQNLNQENYDLVYDAHFSLRSRLLYCFLKAPHKTRWQKNYLRRSMALTFKFPKMADKSRLLERFVRPLAPWGVEYDGGPPEIFVPKEEIEKAFLRLPTLPPQGRWVGFVPSARWEGKRWPSSRFRAVLQGLLETTPNGALIFGDKNDSSCKEICRDLPTHRVVNLQGKTTLTDAMNLLGSCVCVVSNDTGLMHVADALSIPCVTIFGPTSRELGCHPYHAQTKVLEHELWCRPCSKNGQAPCVRGTRLCLELTTAQMVMDSLSTLLKERAIRAPL